MTLTTSPTAPCMPCRLLGTPPMLMPGAGGRGGINGDSGDAAGADAGMITGPRGVCTTVGIGAGVEVGAANGEVNGAASGAANGEVNGDASGAAKGEAAADGTGASGAAARPPMEGSGAGDTTVVVV